MAAEQVRVRVAAEQAWYEAQGVAVLLLTGAPLLVAAAAGLLGGR